MSYELAMAAAGATVHEFREFGSYQGDWWAKVTLRDGRTGWINGSYGSCSGCDAFEAEFSFDDRDFCSEHSFDRSETCEGCNAAKARYDEKLRRFGAGYLDALMTQEEAEAKAKEHAEWDYDAPQMVAFIEQHK